MRKQDLGKVAAYAVVFGLVGGITFEGVNYTAGRLTGNAAVESTASPASKLKTTSTSASGSDETSGTVSGVAANVLPVDRSDRCNRTGADAGCFRQNLFTGGFRKRLRYHCGAG